LHIPYLGWLEKPEEARYYFSERELEGLDKFINDDETKPGNDISEI
jgi:hypothetical protein